MDSVKISSPEDVAYTITSLNDQKDQAEILKLWIKPVIDALDKANKEVDNLRGALMDIDNLLPINSNILLSRRIESIIRQNL